MSYMSPQRAKFIDALWTHFGLEGQNWETLAEAHRKINNSNSSPFDNRGDNTHVKQAAKQDIMLDMFGRGELPL